MTRRVLVVGGGYAGMTAARRLRQKVPADVVVTLVNAHPYMTYQPLLPEAAAGTVSANHVVIPLRTALPGVEVLVGSLVDLDAPARTATIESTNGQTHRVHFAEVVLAVGAVSRTFPVPGLLQHAVGFRTVEEALHLGSRVLNSLETAAATSDPQLRRRALTFVFVGAGYAGVEALAELEDLVRRQLRHYPELETTDVRWVLIEAGDRILGQLPRRLADYVAQRLQRRGVTVLTRTSVVALSDGCVQLSDATSIESETVVWTAGVVASPVVRRLGLPVDKLGRAQTDATLRVVEGVWGIGDCAAVPDVITGGTCPPTAQHAVRQATRVADNIDATLRNRQPRVYRHRDAGAVASLGLGKGVAELFGVPLRGYPAWLVHRIYHGLRLPNRQRRLLVTFHWLLGSLTRDPVALPAIERPCAPLREAHTQQTQVSD